MTCKHQRPFRNEIKSTQKKTQEKGTKNEINKIK